MRQNVLAIVVQHRCWLPADAVNVSDICATNDSLDFRQIVKRGGSDNTSHQMPVFSGFGHQAYFLPDPPPIWPRNISCNFSKPCIPAGSQVFSIASGSSALIPARIC